MYLVSVIVPTLNEAENIDLLCERLLAVKRTFSLNLDILFVDSGSSDKTCERVAKWQRREDVSALHCPAGTGLAEAIIVAANKTCAEFVVVMDADLSHPPEILPELIKPLLDDSSDMVIGSRYVAGGSTPGWPFHRRLLSRLAAIPARLITNVKDPLAGFFAVNQFRLQDLTEGVQGFKIGLEILVANGMTLRVKEVPIEFRDRKYGNSKMTHVIVIAYMIQLFELVKKRLITAVYSEKKYQKERCS